MQKNVIKRFLAPTYEWAGESSTELLNKCVINASNSEYTSYSDIVAAFISSFNSYADKQTFLLDECGIDLTNADSGSIVGSDAGGGQTIAYSFVSETGSVQSAPVNFTVCGLTFHCPSGMSANEQWVCDAIYTWWADDILTKIEDAYGVSFTSSSSVSDISIVFEPPDIFSGSSIIVAYVSQVYVNNTTTSLSLHCPRALVAHTSHTGDIGRYTQGNYNIWLDSVLAHEFVHAVMSANCVGYNIFPALIVEGIADLFCGADMRNNFVSSLISHIGDLNTALAVPGAVSAADYIVAYTFFRWLAKKYDTDEFAVRMRGDCPFLPKLLWGMTYYDKVVDDADAVIDKAFEYATACGDTGPITFRDFLILYEDSYSELDGTTQRKLKELCGIDFDTPDCGCYGGSDAIGVGEDGGPVAANAIIRSKRCYIRRAEIQLFVVQSPSTHFFPLYLSSTYTYNGLTIHLPNMSADTSNLYYKQRIISRLCPTIFKYVLDVLKDELFLDFSHHSYAKDLYIVFDDLVSPTKPFDYVVSFDSGGKADGFYLTVYTYSFIPENDIDPWQVSGLYVANVILYILTVCILMSKLKHARAYYRHPIIPAMAAFFLGYDWGQSDIVEINQSGSVSDIMGGGEFSG